MVTDSATVTIGSLYETTVTLSNGAIADPLRPPLPQNGVPYTPRYVNGHISAMAYSIHLYGHLCDSTAFLYIIISQPFLPARRYASACNSDRNVSVCLSVCPSVRHVPVLCQKEES